MERVVLVTAVTEELLLHPAADFFHRLQPEPDHMEGVEDGGGVFQLVADGVGVAPERIQCGGADAGGEDVPAGTQPVGVRLAGPARHHIQQPSLRPCRSAWSGPRSRSAPSVPFQVAAGGARCAHPRQRCRPRRADRGRRRVRPAAA